MEWSEVKQGGMEWSSVKWNEMKRSLCNCYVYSCMCEHVCTDACVCGCMPCTGCDIKCISYQRQHQNI